MSVSGISSNDQILQMLYQTQNSTLNLSGSYSPELAPMCSYPPAQSAAE